MKRLLCGGMVAAAVIGLLASSDAAAVGPHKINKCITITDPGSYILDTNLAAIGNCLVITADHVTIDFDGFKISGNGAGSCVYDNGTFHEGIVIKNGTVRGCGTGINLGSSAEGKIEEMRVLANSDGNGISVGSRWIIKNNVIADNDCSGINGDDRIVVVQNVVSGNGCTGIDVSRESVIEQNTAQNNDGDGIRADEASVVKNNSCSDNTGNGIRTEDGSVIIANACKNNGDVGINVDCPSVVRLNTAISNTSNDFEFNNSGCSSGDNAPD